MFNGFMNKASVWLMNLRDKLARFMYGRYGVDQLYRALMIKWFVLIFVSFIVQAFTDSWLVHLIFTLVQTVIVVIMFARAFSRNLEKRSRENVKYLEMTKKNRSWFNLQKRRFRERKTHAFRKCPSCKRMLRL